MNKEVDTYKIFRELEAREKRANPYKFYDKDELIDEILKDEDEIERLNNIIKEVREYIEERYNGEVLTHTFDKDNVGELLNILKEVIKSE